MITIYRLVFLYLILVFTKATDIHFHVLWLASVTRDIQDCHLEAKVKMTGSARTIIDRKKVYIVLLFFDDRVFLSHYFGKY